MKQAILILLIVVATAFVGRDRKQDPKLITVSLPKEAWQVVVDVIDNAPLDGNTRKPILNAIITQVNKQLSDSTKQKK